MAFLNDMQQQGRAAGLAGRPSPEEKARWAARLAQLSGQPLDRQCDVDIEALDMDAMLRVTPLWAVYHMIGEFLKGVTPDRIARATTYGTEVPTESDMASVVAVYLKMMTDLLRLTEGWDTTARRNATLAQLGLHPPCPHKGERS